MPYPVKGLRMPTRPLAVWIIVAMAIGVALYQFPTYRIPWAYSPIYFIGCGLLTYGFYAGARWAFVVNVLTAWIFPYETYLGVKGTLHGSTLSVLQFISLGLMFWSWEFYWKKAKGGTP